GPGCHPPRGGPPEKPPRGSCGGLTPGGAPPREAPPPPPPPPRPPPGPPPPKSPKPPLWAIFSPTPPRVEVSKPIAAGPGASVGGTGLADPGPAGWEGGIESRARRRGGPSIQPPWLGGGGAPVLRTRRGFACPHLTQEPACPPGRQTRPPPRRCRPPRPAA